jgi:hypothetical protein
LAAATSESRRHKDRQYQRVSQPAPPLHIGMQVYRRRLYTRSRDPGTALRPRWDGPFEIRAIKPPTTYILVDPRRPHRHTVVHRDLIRPAKANSPK